MDSVEAEGDVDFMRIALPAVAGTGADLLPKPVAALLQVHEALVNDPFHYACVLTRAAVHDERQEAKLPDRLADVEFAAVELLQKSAVTKKPVVLLGSPLHLCDEYLRSTAPATRQQVATVVQDRRDT